MAGREAQEEEEEEEKEVLTGHGKGPGAAGTVQDLPGGGGSRAWHTHMSTGMPQTANKASVISLLMEGLAVNL